MKILMLNYEYPPLEMEFECGARNQATLYLYFSSSGASQKPRQLQAYNAHTISSVII